MPTAHHNIIHNDAKTRVESLYQVLSDRKWHTTADLVAQVGHTFAQAKWCLIRLGYSVDRRRSRANQFSYRLAHTAGRPAPLARPRPH